MLLRNIHKIVLALGIVLTLELLALHLEKPSLENNAGLYYSPESNVNQAQFAKARPSIVVRAAALIPSTVKTAQASLLELENEIDQSLQSQSVADRERCFDELLPAMVRRDASATGYFAEMLAADAYYSRVLNSVARSWATQDPASAFQWISHLPVTSDQRAKLVSEACFQIATTDPAQAVEAAQQYNLDKTDPGGLENLTQQWAAYSLSASLAWVQNEPPGELRNQLLAHIAFVQSQSAPADAASLVAELIPPGADQIEAAISVLHQWGLRDMPAAMTWAQSFPDGPVRNRAFAELAGMAQTKNRE